MSKFEYQIDHPSQLNVLIESRLFRKPGRGKIRLSPELDHPDKEQWESDINRFYYACGCSSGAKGLMLALVVCIAAGIPAYLFDFLTLKQTLGFTGIAVVAGVVVGKWVGLRSARQRLSRVVHTIQAHWKPRWPTEKPMLHCG